VQGVAARSRQKGLVLAVFFSQRDAQFMAAAAQVADQRTAIGQNGAD
jgi:hypothetical protein